MPEHGMPEIIVTYDYVKTPDGRFWRVMNPVYLEGRPFDWLQCRRLEGTRRGWLFYPARRTPRARPVFPSEGPETYS